MTTTEKTPSAAALLARYKSELTVGPPVNTAYFVDDIREKNARLADRIEVAAAILSPRTHESNTTPEAQREWLEAGLFSREELDELVEVGRREFEQWVADQQRRELDKQLREEKRRVERELARREAEERSAKIEKIARQNLGWPAQGYPSDP